ncbi:hypothetical protein [Mesorhizobium escarrei]|nr:hypothetical protein [Mesorhizobium escarrei]
MTSTLPAAGKAVQNEKGISPMDIVVLGIGFLFFALFFAFVKACDSL